MCACAGANGQEGAPATGEGEEAALPDQAKCPISCSADSEGWNLVFECEEEGQKVTKTYYPGFTTEFKDGKPYVYGEMDFKFETSGNVYHAVIDVRPCEKSPTGYCITAEVTGNTPGNEPVTCKNF